MAVDLLNTVMPTGAGPADLLQDREDVASWAEAAGLGAEALRRQLQSPAGRGEPRNLRAFREALRRGFRAWQERGSPPGDLVQLLNDRTAADPRYAELVLLGRMVEAHPCSTGGALDRLYADLALSAGDMLRRDNPERLRKCANPGCPLWFLDLSRAGRRRWCSMKLCGGGAKVRTVDDRPHP